MHFFRYMDDKIQIRVHIYRPTVQDSKDWAFFACMSTTIALNCVSIIIWSGQRACGPGKESTKSMGGE